MKLEIGFKMIQRSHKYPDEYHSALQHSEFPIAEKSPYSKKRVLIGWEWKNTYAPPSQRERRERWIETSPHRAFILGTTGSGKTFFQKSLISRFYKSGYNCFIVDLHDEYSQMCEPIQEKFREFLNKNEKPEGLKVLTIRPLFFQKYSQEEDKKSVYFQIPFSEITAQDLIDFCGLDAGYSDIIIKHKESCDTIEEFLETVSAKEKAKPLVRAIENIIENKVIGDGNVIDFIKEFNEGKIIVLNLLGYESVINKYYQVYIKHILAKIFNARGNAVRGYSGSKLKSEIFIFIDEAHSIMPKDANNMAVKEVVKLVVEGRKFGLSFYFSTQKLESVNTAAYDQSKYLFISNNNKNFSDLDKLMKFSGAYDAHWRFKNKLSEMLYAMKNFGEWRCWGLFPEKINPDHPRLELFFPFSPVCAHYSTSEDKKR